MVRSLVALKHGADLTRKCNRELDYGLDKEVRTFSEKNVAVRFAYPRAMFRVDRALVH